VKRNSASLVDIVFAFLSPPLRLVCSLATPLYSYTLCAKLVESVIILSTLFSGINYCFISSFRRGGNEILALQECYTAFIGSYLPTFRDNQSIRSRKVRHSSRIDLLLNMGPICCPDISVTTKKHGETSQKSEYLNLYFL
jgi:hypothetical protein